MTEIWFVCGVVQPIMIISCIMLFKDRKVTMGRALVKAIGLFWLINPIMIYLMCILRELRG